MLHRALYGSLERFFAVLVEHYAGAFPVWLAPVQARVVTISEKQEAWAQKVAAELKGRGFRVDSDLSADKVGAKIRRAQGEKRPVMPICGPNRLSNEAATPRGCRPGAAQHRWK
jgi:threonyl-tRNA synthetase